MADLLVRNISPELERRIKDSARKNKRSLSAETKALIEQGLVAPTSPEKIGTFLFSVLDEKYRGDDLLFERRDVVEPPPNFE